MVSKWKIKGLGGYVFGENKKLYRLDFESKGKYYGIREIKKQKGNRYRINNQWYSERQLKSRIYLDDNPVELEKDFEYPF